MISMSDLVQHYSKIYSDSLVLTANILKLPITDVFLASPDDKLCIYEEYKYTYHNLMDNLGIITDKGEPRVLSYVFKVWCNWGSSRKFRKTSTFCLVPNFFKVKSCKRTCLYIHSDKKRPSYIFISELTPVFDKIVYDLSVAIYLITINRFLTIN